MTDTALPHGRDAFGVLSLLNCARMMPSPILAHAHGRGALSGMGICAIYGNED